MIYIHILEVKIGGGEIHIQSQVDTLGISPLQRFKTRALLIILGKESSAILIVNLFPVE
jgi:hypothetical protein